MGGGGGGGGGTGRRRRRESEAMKDCTGQTAVDNDGDSEGDDYGESSDMEQAEWGRQLRTCSRPEAGRIVVAEKRRCGKHAGERGQVT